MTLSRRLGATCAASLLFLASLSACAGLPGPDEPAAVSATGLPTTATDQALAAIVRRHGIVTAGVGVIRNGALVWEGYYGEQSPGVPASAATRFNVASVTKTVAAETILRLVAQGRLSLDEPMAVYWVDPDLAADPRHRLLTPRMALNHSTGFPNWRFFLRGGKLAFVNPPGEGYSYSGEGLEYVARFAELKLDQPFPRLVDEMVLSPLDMTSTSLIVNRDEADDIARPVDEAGAFPGYWCRPEGAGRCRADGSYSAADDMVTTVRDYAAFLRAVIDADGYGPDIAADRDRVQTDKGADSIVDCAAVPAEICPDAQGYGLGFNVLRYGEVTVLEHGGADWSDLAVVYVSGPTRSGVIIFLNAPNARALAAMPELLEQIDPASPMLGEHRRWLARSRTPTPG